MLSDKWQSLEHSGPCSCLGGRCEGKELYLCILLVRVWDIGVLYF